MTRGDAGRVRWLKWILCAGFAAGFLVTRPLWSTDRLYPLAPVFDALPVLRAPYDRALYGLALLLLGGIAVREKVVPWATAFLVLIGYLALEDQSRWHPWFYWYSFMMLAVLEAGRAPRGAGRLAGTERARDALQACRVLLIGSYVWAGVQKIGVTFYSNLFPWMLRAFVASPETHPLWSKIGFAIPILEITVGLLLLLPAYRQIAVAMAVGLHVTILILLGPLGQGANVNVWPWNACLIGLVIVLFGKSSEVTARSVVAVRTPLHAAAVLLFFVMPAFTLLDLWDAYPGFSLYSGSQRAGYLQLDDRAKAALPERLASYVDGQNRLLATKWAMGEVGTPEYAEPRVYRRMLEYVCAFAPASTGSVELVVLGKPSRFTGERTVEHTERCPGGVTPPDSSGSPPGTR